MNEYLFDDDIYRVKILDFQEPSYCKLYARSNSSGHILILLADWYNSSRVWKVVYWRTIWSKSGSANEFIWPYCR